MYFPQKYEDVWQKVKCILSTTTSKLNQAHNHSTKAFGVPQEHGITHFEAPRSR